MTTRPAILPKQLLEAMGHGNDPDCTVCQAVAAVIYGPGRPYVDIVFDGPPAHESGRFVEVEDPDGASVDIGTWIDRGDGTWALRIAAASRDHLSGILVGTAPTHGLPDIHRALGGQS